MKKGFTMIELIFVIVILGILASVAIPRLAATREDAEISAAVANLRTLVSDATAYYTAKGEFGNVTWKDLINVPLQKGEKSPIAATDQANTAGANLAAGGKNCIAVQLVEKNGATPAYISITKANGATGVCSQVVEAAPVKAYLDATGVTGKTGSIAIGSSTSVYPPATAPKPAARNGKSS